MTSAAPDFAVPGSLPEALELLAEHGEEACVMAGGTAIALLLRQRLLRQSVIVSLGRCAELSAIAEGPSGLRIGALASYRDIERSADVRRRHPELARTAAAVATPRIRNQATIGGCLALADPHFDLPVSLLALDATVELSSPGGTRRLAIDELAVDVYETAVRPGEIITAVDVPPPTQRSALAFEKFLAGSADDYAAVDVAVRVALDAAGAVADARVVLGSVGPRVFRSRTAEGVLRGRIPSDRALTETGAAAAAETDPDSDTRGSREHKRGLAEVLVARLGRRAVERALAGRSTPAGPAITPEVRS